MARSVDREDSLAIQVGRKAESIRQAITSPWRMQPGEKTVKPRRFVKGRIWGTPLIYTVSITRGSFGNPQDTIRVVRVPVNRHNLGDRDNANRETLVIATNSRYERLGRETVQEVEVTYTHGETTTASAYHPITRAMNEVPFMTSLMDGASYEPVLQFLTDASGLIRRTAGREGWKRRLGKVFRTYKRPTPHPHSTW